MTLQLLIWTILLGSTAVFGQTINITGTWKQPRAIHVRHYTFDSGTTFKQDEYGDLSEYHFTGHYSVRKDSIFLAYDTTITFQNKKVLPAPDTLLILNKNVIKVNDYLYIFNEDRSESKLSVDNSGVLNYKIKNFGDTFLLQHYVFYKWLTTDTFVNADSVFLILRNYQLPLHSGKNTFRIKSQFDKEYVKPFEVESKTDKITIDSKKVFDKIHLSGKTYYELYDNYGTIIKKGTGDTIDCSNLQTGHYYLNFDNETAKIKKE